MSLSRSPSPHPGGGWSSPGLTPGSGTSTPRNDFLSPNSHGPSSISWAAARAKSDEVRGYPSFSTRNNGFFSRSKRKISSSLPRFRMNGASSNGYHDKDEYWRGQKSPGMGLRFGFARGLLRRRRLRAFLGLIILFLGYLFFWTAIIQNYRRSSFGGGRKFVIILQSNVEGGVMEWKGAREWALERNSIWNKREYTKRWGYELEVVNMLAKKRYSHEWRESWEKVDIIREAMRKYPNAEWFWWLDLNTWVMEYSYSLQEHIFDRLETLTYRDINMYNPLNITHPPTAPYLDAISRSAEGDGDPSSIELLLSQDCGGFNLGSFFIKRSLWSDRLLDTWWDPVMYEQKHMDWEHKEQDALEYLYQSQPWIRSSVAFIPQRFMNAFPPGACGEGGDPDVHYSESERDFLVNMAGCQFGRDCWGEMYQYRELSKQLNRTGWQRVQDRLAKFYKKLLKKGGKSEDQQHNMS
ncbi:putative alpha-1,6-mannosyltransferase subunit [Aspergillus clavatus NRRL 1]|uniref:Alpha-1,6-mannosyltransferase subunit, putative n=1 Tax=Aspergillus clavatus (strain ATCC 1007 / CBS 513.65 / DSM 816 / NCTC 3887 / NRRL 1 / QM 1276 / 107) TaxID=344612 RepID=A1C753_ASPCL|nr:alpha-1,6-mannosyltransferase subunit, putative [Aspergillus clavatus NRRL 1]EAW14224.1 alpha-1,6-mannosyltransferase subunit, putative [Aspergillus clavatus NRRL 1]